MINIKTFNKMVNDKFKELKNKSETLTLKQSKLNEIELTKKENSGTITEEERGYLYGLRTFPDNFRGQELRKKEHLGFLSQSEKEELRRLYQLKNRQESMSYELQKLWERTEANDPNVVQVSMNNGKLVKVLLNDEQEKVIWTYGLGGCFGSLVFSEDENKCKIVILTHFDPLSIYANISELERLIKSNISMKTSKCKQYILFLEGQYEQNLQTKQWKIENLYQQKADMLINTIQIELGQDVEIKIEPYSTLRDITTKDQGSLIVRIPPKGQATYRTWFSQGQLGRCKL